MHWNEGTTRFEDNSALSGGAIHLMNGSAISWTGNTDFVSNEALGDKVRSDLTPWTPFSTPRTPPSSSAGLPPSHTTHAARTVVPWLWSTVSRYSSTHRHRFRREFGRNCRRCCLYGRDRCGPGLPRR